MTILQALWFSNSELPGNWMFHFSCRFQCSSNVLIGALRNTEETKLPALGQLLKASLHAFMLRIRKRRYADIAFPEDIYPRNRSHPKHLVTLRTEEKAFRVPANWRPSDQVETANEGQLRSSLYFEISSCLPVWEFFLSPKNFSCQFPGEFLKYSKKKQMPSSRIPIK